MQKNLAVMSIKTHPETDVLNLLGHESEITGAALAQGHS